MRELDQDEIEDLRNDDRTAAMITARLLRGECPVCGEADCGGCEDGEGDES